MLRHFPDENILRIQVAKNSTGTQFIPPRRQDPKRRKIFLNLARFASLREVLFVRFRAPNSREKIKDVGIVFND
jgi:hypothetical protein